MRRVFRLILGVLLLTTALCRGENCAWLNAATAGGVLGGHVTSTVVHTTPQDTTCEFTRSQGAGISSLRIAVHTMTAFEKEFPAYLTLCGTTAISLRAVGNEAVECTRPDGQDVVTEQVIGRVRDRVFILRWSMPKSTQGIGVQSQDDIRETIRNVAEQIAGSLF